VVSATTLLLALLSAQLALHQSCNAFAVFRTTRLRAIFLAVFGLAGCVQQYPATVEYHGDYHENRVPEKEKATERDDDAALARGSLLPADDSSYGIKPEVESYLDSNFDALPEPQVQGTPPRLEIEDARRLDSGVPSTAFAMPAKGGRIIEQFGRSGKKFNDGITILLPDGADIMAAADGTVAYVGRELLEYGSMVIIEHKGDAVTSYARMRDSGVKVGEKVKRGHVIGRVGKGEHLAVPQLLFSLRIEGIAVDPLKYIT
jgi:murein DD-endopeptidase MepM/ murein hydrolase activator NlpD